MRLTPTTNPQILEITGVSETDFLFPTCGVHFSSQYPCLLSLLMMVALTLEQREWRLRSGLAESEPWGLRWLAVHHLTHSWQSPGVARALSLCPGPAAEDHKLASCGICGFLMTALHSDS